MSARHPAGFTLLEILVALVVLGFLMVGLSEGTRFGLRAWKMQTQLADERGGLDAVDRTICDLVTHMDPGSATRASTLQGSASRVAFTSDLPMAAAGLPSRRADMLLTVDAAHSLVLLWTPHLHAKRFGPAPPPQQAELLQNVDRIEVLYWKINSGGWRKTWTGRDLPGLVRFRIVFRAGDWRRWPDIVAAPVLDRQGD